jgi:hypothetical protein
MGLWGLVTSPAGRLPTNDELEGGPRLLGYLLIHRQFDPGTTQDPTSKGERGVGRGNRSVDRVEGKTA